MGFGSTVGCDGFWINCWARWVLDQLLGAMHLDALVVFGQEGGINLPEKGLRSTKSVSGRISTIAAEVSPSATYGCFGRDTPA